MKEMDDILAKYFSGEATPEEIGLVKNWRVENEEEFQSLSTAWNDTDLTTLKNHTFKNFDTKAAWGKIDPKLKPEKQTKVISIGFYKKLAAACAALLIGFAGYWMLSNGDDFVEIANNGNTPKVITLPDESTIWLASNATLKHNNDFENNRSLTLEGEAFFEVARDEKHPFTIETAYGNVEVLGTGFNVDVRTKETVVTVSHGKVAVENTSGEKVILTKGQSTHSSDTELSSTENAEINYDSWKTGIFNFTDTPLSEAIPLLNKYYDKEIILETPEKGQEMLTGEYSKLSLNEVIDVITLTCNLTSKAEENVIRLR